MFIASGFLIIILAVFLAFASVLSARTYYLTSDSLPYTVHADYDTLKIQGSKIVSSGDGINFNGHDDVVLDLGGDTLVFGNSSGDNYKGLFVGWNSHDVHIKNGWIIHQPTSTLLAQGNTCVYLAGSNGTLIENVNLVVDGTDGICLQNNSGGYNIEISGGSMRSNSLRFTSRCTNSGSVIRLLAEQQLPGPNDWHFIIHDLTITDGPHSGIAINQASASAGENKVWIYNNHITTDSRNLLYDLSDYQANFCRTAADAYGISLNHIAAGSKIHDNIIRSGNEYEGNLGILVQVCRGEPDNPVIIENNDVHTWQGPNAAWPDGKCNSLYFRNVPGESPRSSYWTVIRGNAFKCTVDNDPLTTAMGSKAEVVSVFLEDSSSNNIFENNLVELIAKNGDLSNLHGSNNAIGFSIRDTTDPCCTEVRNNIWRNNHYRAFRAPVNFSGQRGYPGSNILLQGDTLECTDLSATDSTTVIFDGSTGYRMHATNNRLRDCVFMGSSNESDVVFSFQSLADIDGKGQDVTFERTLKVYVKGSNGLPVTNATVWAANNYGDTLFTGTTNEGGLVSGVVSYKYYAKDPVDGDQYVLEDSLNFNPFTLKAQKYSDNDVVSYTVNSENGSDTLTLSGILGDGTWGAGDDPGEDCTTPPSTPTLYSPANGVETGVRPTLCANNSNGGSCPQALLYHFQIGTSSNMSTIVAQYNGVTEGMSHTCYTPSIDLNEGQTYYWRARAYNGSVYSGWSTVRQFTVSGGDANSAPTTPTPSSPMNGGHINSLTPTLVINNSYDADGDQLDYQFQISTSTAFYTIPAQVAHHPEGYGSTTSWTSNASLNNNTTYYWRVRAYDGESYSSFSQVRSFYVNVDVSNDPPSAPSAASPVAGYMSQSTTPNLVVNNSIDPDGDNLSYYFEIWNSQRSALITSSGAVPEGDANSTAWMADPPLPRGQRYYWKCRSFDGEDYSAWMGWSYFDVAAGLNNTPPAQPTTYLPHDGDTLIGSSHILIVFNTTDPDNDPLTYEFRLCADEDMSSVIEQANNVPPGPFLTTSHATAAALNDGQTYRWQSRAFDGSDYSEWTTIKHFTHYDISVSAEDIPTPVSPVEGQKISTVSPTFRIYTDETDVDVDFYFEVADNPEFNMAISSGPVRGILGGTEWTLYEELESGSAYYWRARAEESGWSDPVSFMITADIHIAPNPFRPHEHPEGVVFKNIPRGAEIKILTANGDLVRRLDDLNGPDVRWDVTNENGQQLSTGVYLYYVISDKTSASGKLAIIR